MSYYSEPNLSYQQERASSIFSQTVAGSSSQHPNEHGDDGDQNESTRYCSVRGCTSVLPLNYGNKMCDMCRGRHRVYASTKRAKRKMEKAALGMQNGWTPGGEGAQDLEVSTSSSNALPGQEVRAHSSCCYFVMNALLDGFPRASISIIHLFRGHVLGHGSRSAAFPAGVELFVFGARRSLDPACFYDSAVAIPRSCPSRCSAS